MTDVAEQEQTDEGTWDIPKQTLTQEQVNVIAWNFFEMGFKMAHEYLVERVSKDTRIEDVPDVLRELYNREVEHNQGLVKVYVTEDYDLSDPETREYFERVTRTQ